MWIGCQFNMISAAIVGAAALAAVLTPGIDAAMAGFILAMVNSQAMDVSVHSVSLQYDELTYTRRH